ncbi:MAG: tetratricopeptide repeat protein [Candidatus Omnitrophota bacterium]|nr:tetratricopeptide repeat protein [Candidatus Omnitrophota bacterium]
MLKIICFIAALLFSSLATTVVYHKTQQSDIYYFQGHRFFNAGNFDQAIIFSKKSLAIRPRRLDALKDAAYSCQWTGRHKEAIEYFRTILSINPKDIQVKESLALTLAWEKQYVEAINIYRDIIKTTGNYGLRTRLAEVLIWNKEFDKAEVLLRDILWNKPRDLESMINLADILSWQGKYAQAIKKYTRALVLCSDNPDTQIYLEVKRKLADVLSWDKQYKRAIAIYDELIRTKEDKQAWLQKARVLGWQRRYVEAANAYQELLEKTGDPLVALEMKAKQAYWDSRVKGAIDDYAKLISLDPKNEEAMFDLSQIYSYQSKWKEAIGEYGRILNLTPTHFRAKEGLKKAGLISSHQSLKSGYEFYEADSSARMDDLKRHSFFNKFVYPLDHHLTFNLDYRLTNRLFSDFADVLENEGRLKLVYLNNPDWRADAFYDLVLYNKDIDAMHTFGTSYSFRFFDRNTANFSYERKRLENNSTVIREHFYGDNFKGRFDIDINKRMKLGADYLFTNYSDGNNNQEPGIDLLYHIFLEPKSLALRYRYFYQNFLHKVSEYFSPKGFSTNALKIAWRHFLNKEEIFFGGNDLYYDLAYEVSADSTGLVFHNFSAEFNWDINKRLNLNIKGSDTQSSANVYRDRNIMASLNYYF